MFAIRSAVIPVLASFVFAGCTHLPATQPVKPDVLGALQPVEVKVGIRQAELYAAFVRSNAAATGAAACGAVPGLGILLAAACGGAMGAVDASVNAARAKAAEESIRPLKDELIEVDFDQLMRASVAQSLQSVPDMQLADVAVTKTVTTEAYEKTFKASTSNAVMFINLDYHLSSDFSTLEVSARGLIYPRGATARKAAKLPAALSATPSEPALGLQNAAYRSNIIYRAKHPAAGDDAAKNIAAWKADNARLLKLALLDGIAQSTTLLAADLQSKHPVYASATAHVDTPLGLKANLVAQRDSGKLLRYPDGSLYFDAALANVAAAAPVQAPAAAGAAPAAPAVAAAPAPVAAVQAVADTAAK